MVSQWRPLIIALAAAAVSAMAASSCFAVPREQLKTCESKDDISADRRIAACSAVIDTAGVNKQQTSEAYTSRGKAYRTKGQADKAMQDFDQALALDPRNAEAHHQRGLAFRDGGDIEHALGDLEQAVKYDRRNTGALNALSHPPRQGRRCARHRRFQRGRDHRPRLCARLQESRQRLCRRPRLRPCDYRPEPRDRARSEHGARLC